MADQSTPKILSSQQSPISNLQDYHAIDIPNISQMDDFKDAFYFYLKQEDSISCVEDPSNTIY